MHSTIHMQANPYEQQKNFKAAAITLGFHAALLLLCWLVVMVTPAIPPPPAEEGIEVNLGNSDIGFGDVQPLVPDEPAPAIETQQAPPPQQTVAEVAETEKEMSESDADAPELAKPVKKATPVKKDPVPATAPSKNKPAVAAVVNPTPAPPKPKAVYGGGTGTGGNNSDSYNNSRNQGIAGGRGDQGKPNGSASSDNYNGSGGGGRGGPRITKGDRKIVRHYSFTGDLDRATIFAIVKVSPDGRGTFAGFGQGSTAVGADYRNAIIQYLRNIQFDQSDHESTVTVQFNFSIN